MFTRRNDVKWVATLETSAQTLLVRGATDDAATCQTALRRWLGRKAEDHLLPWLKRISNKTGLSYAAASIRQQQTRWGSCSSQRLINLNARSLFLRPNLVTYMLVHGVVSYEALKPFTQILTVGRVLSDPLSEIESATVRRRPIHSRMADSILRPEGRTLRC